MRFFLDTEFIEDGTTIDLISIGIVSEDGRIYYAESSDCCIELAGDWVKKNVLPHLRGKTQPRHVIAQDIREFVGDKPQFWGYYAAYDWVALCQLYGTMADLPSGWPMYCRDLQQICDAFSNPRLPRQPLAQHNALDDALWNYRAFEVLRGMARAFGIKLL